jgi:tRNA nucleotidyltransferase/poly(A) polymerase
MPTMPGTQTRRNDEMLQTVAAVLAHHGAEGWLVGGSVRHLQLGCDSPDIDLAVTGDACAIARDVARGLGSPWFALSERHGAYRVVGERAHVDVAALRGGSILADLAERDFTVNAMAKPIGAHGLLGDLADPFGGLADLAARRLAAVSQRIFEDDPLRLMRAARFGHVLGLVPTPALREAVLAQAGEVKRAAPERVATEMILTLDAGRAGDAARLWEELGLLQAVLPELGRPEERGALFEFMDSLENTLADLGTEFPAVAPRLERRLAEPIDGAVKRRTALRLAALLRDVEPAQALKAGRRLRLSSPMISLMETAARMNQRGALPQVTGVRGPGREAVLFLWASAPWEPEAILLAAAACWAEAPESGHVAGARATTPAEALMTTWDERAERGILRLPFDGNDLMEELGLEPGPRLGAALRAARLAWEAGEAVTAEQALAVARAALERG